VANAARMGKMRNAFWLRSLSGADHPEDSGAVLYVNTVWGCILDSSGSELRPMAGSCERGNEPSGSVRAKN
jgi:hypothetical protein